MKAMQLDQAADISTGPLTERDMALPEPDQGQIRVRVRACGVCRTDLHIAEGDIDLPKLPLTPGHQIIGMVDRVGPGAGRYRIGDRVGIAWLYWSCGECDFCLAGSENLCPRAQFTGLHADGGYGEFLVVDERFAYPISETFTDDSAAPLLCAGIIGYRSLRLSNVSRGGKLGLYGFGASAHLVIQVARYRECEVYVFTRSKAHRWLAEELGAVWVGGAEDDCPAKLDGSVIFAPAGKIVPLALGHLRPGGTVAINAIHMSTILQFEYSLIYGERVLRSVANFTRKDAEEFLSLAAKIPIQSEVELFTLEEANEALKRMKESGLKAAAVLKIARR